jgi:hypothetical protein
MSIKSSAVFERILAKFSTFWKCTTGTNFQGFLFLIWLKLTKIVKIVLKFFLKRESGDFNNLQDSLRANPHALSSGQVKLDFGQGKIMK